MRNILFIVCTFVLASPAFAHIGHVGELAGHGHIIAIGATIAASALAGLVAKRAKDKTKKGADAKGTEAGSKPETTGAPA